MLAELVEELPNLWQLTWLTNESMPHRLVQECAKIATRPRLILGNIEWWDELECEVSPLERALVNNPQLYSVNIGYRAKDRCVPGCRAYDDDSFVANLLRHAQSLRHVRLHKYSHISTIEDGMRRAQGLPSPELPMR